MAKIWILLLFSLVAGLSVFHFAGADSPWGNLQARVHPLSPKACGVEVVEVGSVRPSGDFEPQMAFLKDSFDESFPGISPKIRKIYSYGAPSTTVTVRTSPEDYSQTQSIQIPSTVFEVEQVKKHLISKLIYNIALSAASVVPGIPQMVAFAGMTLRDSISRWHTYHRVYALYTLLMMLESGNKTLSDIISPLEVSRALAVGGAYDFRGILMSPYFRDLVAQYQTDQRRENRSVNKRNLIFMLNREGLIAKPLFNDFIVVLYDPAKPLPRILDTLYLDMKPGDESLPKTRDGLVALGVFALGQKADRLKTLDFNSKNAMKRRKWVFNIVEKFKNAGLAFLQFPLTYLIKGTRDSSEWILNKAGTNVLADTLESEAELAACLDSGICQIDPEMVEKMRSDLNRQKVEVLLRLDGPSGDERKNFAKNARLMTNYLKEYGGDLCEEVASVREKEFRSSFLGPWEALSRRVSLSWKKTWSLDLRSLEEERKKIITQRTPRLEARLLLAFFDESRESNSPGDVIRALGVLAREGRSSDAYLIARRIDFTANPDVEVAAIQAAGIHRNGDLAIPLINYLKRVEVPGARLQDLPLADVMKSLLQIKIEDSVNPEVIFSEALKQIDRFLGSEVDALVRSTDDSLRKRYNSWEAAQKALERQKENERQAP